MAAAMKTAIKASGRDVDGRPPALSEVDASVVDWIEGVI
jgi:hypothetical protein